MEKTANIEYLYLDLNTCDRCMGTDVILEERTAGTYVLPQNLKDFYRGKMTKNVKCCCGGNSDCC